MKNDIDFTAWEKSIEKLKDFRVDGSVTSGEIAKKFGKNTSTVRSWLEQQVKAGEVQMFPGRLRGREVQTYKLTPQKVLGKGRRK